MSNRVPILMGSRPRPIPIGTGQAPVDPTAAWVPFVRPPFSISPTATVPMCEEHPIDHFADRSHRPMQATQAPVCVGIDPVWGTPCPPRSRPRSIRRPSSAAKAVADNLRVRPWASSALSPALPCVKFQSPASRGTCGWRRGVTIDSWARRRLGPAGDRRRENAATSDLVRAFTPRMPGGRRVQRPGPARRARRPDCQCLFGDDSLRPSSTWRPSQGKGLFALVRTSNPGGDALQSLSLADGRSVADVVAGIVAKVGDARRGAWASRV